MRHVLILVRILKPFVRIDRIAPDSIADQLTHCHWYLPAIHEIMHANIHFLVDALDNVVAEIEAIKEVDQFRITLRTQRLVGELYGQGESICSDDTINVSATS
jgi:tRNA A37 threonylcarbamoyladenosine dehydratase